MVVPKINERIRLVDIFSGCGGFSLGAQQAGFSVVAAVDNDPILTYSYPYNFPYTRLVLNDVTKLGGEAICAAAGGSIDGIFGGPPCQGFSVIGKHDRRDPRRRLLGHFFRIIRDIMPSFFVMENVLGLAFANARDVLDKALAQVPEYAIFGPEVWNAAQFGAATNRSRLFVIGVRKDFGEPFTSKDISFLRQEPATVQAAICDLENATIVGDACGFDTWRIDPVAHSFDYACALRSSDGQFTGHRITQHSERVMTRFNDLAEGGFDRIGRHPRLAWLGQSPAIRAGTGADRGSFQAVRPVHPRHPRVITVREAARLQGFPDNHRFHPTIWHSFRMIGNSVSPIMARAIFSMIYQKLGDEIISRRKSRERYRSSVRTQSSWLISRMKFKETGAKIGIRASECPRAC